MTNTRWPAIAALFPCLLLAGAVPAQKKGEDTRLKEAIKLIFRDRTEPSVRQGAQLLRDMNNVEAIEVLLKVLNDNQPHFRDIVWEVLPDFTDPYARKRIEQELKTNKKDEETRQWCAELLGHYGDAAFGATLLAAATSEKNLGVVWAATRALGQVRMKAAVPQLEKLARHKDIYIRAAAIEALVRVAAPSAELYFTSGLADADAGVRCALLGVVPELYKERVETLSTAAIADADWRPRMQAVDNLARVKTKGAVAALVRATGDVRPVVVVRAVESLRRLLDLKFASAREWQEWWKDHEREFDFASAEAAATRAAASQRAPADRTVTTYNGIEVVSDHVAFLLDKSATMTHPLKSNRVVKEEAALAELKQVLERLVGQLTFNVFLYADHVEAFAKAPVLLDKANAKKAVDFVTKDGCHGNKNIWQALRTVLDDPTLDTIYLLSAGEPEVGVYVHWNRVTRYLRELNRFHKVVVHTIVYNDSKWFREQLEKIAEATGGTFKGFE